VGESGNVAAVRRYVDAFNRLDLDAATSGLDPAIELREWPEAPGSQAYHGVDGVRRAFDTWFEMWEWMKLEIEEIHPAGDSVLFTLHQRAKGRTSAVEVEIRSYNVYTFRDGLLTLAELFVERENALAAAGLTEEDIRQEAT
jgi:ketosteroid isomerase-like protein